MKNRNLTSKMVALILIGAGFVATSCNKSDDGSTINPNSDTNSAEQIFNIGYGEGLRGTAEGAILPLTEANLKSGEIDFNKVGFKLERSRTHRLYSTNNGNTVYFLSYLNNQVTKYTVGGNDGYKDPLALDAKSILGGSNGRWKVVNEDTALIYGVTTQDEKDNNGNFVRKVSTLRIAPVNLKDFTLGAPKTYALPQENNPDLLNQHIWRIDQPVIYGGKVYIGVAKQGYDPTKAEGERDIDGEQIYNSSTLVLDYPSLENPKIIESTLGKGETYGYRTPSYFEYNGSIYHVNMTNSRIFKITDGTYDNSYDFDVSKALGVEVGGTGIFYVADGIAYMPFYEMSKGMGSAAAAWGIARVDLKNKTAIKMNLPTGLWLRYYQSAKAVNGKLYMAICPINSTKDAKAEGNIYIFDSTKADANGFEVGAKVLAAGEGFYLGVF